MATNKVITSGDNVMKPHYLMNKGECMEELAAFGHPVKNPKEFMVAEVKVLVRENRIAAGLISEHKGQQDVMALINRRSWTSAKRCASSAAYLCGRRLVWETFASTSNSGSPRMAPAPPFTTAGVAAMA